MLVLRVAFSQVRLSSISCRRMPDAALAATDSSVPCCRSRAAHVGRTVRFRAPIHVGHRRILGSIIHPRVSYRAELRAASSSPVGRSVGQASLASF